MKRISEVMVVVRKVGKAGLRVERASALLVLAGASFLLRVEWDRYTKIPLFSQLLTLRSLNSRQRALNSLPASPNSQLFLGVADH